LNNSLFRLMCGARSCIVETLYYDISRKVVGWLSLQEKWVTRILPEAEELPAREADNFAAICEPIA
jgi:hypothetical protein